MSRSLEKSKTAWFTRISSTFHLECHGNAQWRGALLTSIVPGQLSGGMNKSS